MGFAAAAASLLTVASAGSPSVCALYCDASGYNTRFGQVLPNGSFAPFPVSITQDMLDFGVTASDGVNPFYFGDSQPGASSKLYFVNVTSASKVNVTSSSFASMPGYTGAPTFENLNIDTARGQVLAMVSYSPSNSYQYCLIADVFPHNGTVGTVWLDITSFCNSLLMFKTGVSAFDPTRKIFYIAGLPHPPPGNCEANVTVWGFPLNGGGQHSSFPRPFESDILAMQYSAERDSLVTFVLEQGKNFTVSYEEVAASAASNTPWTVLYKYPTWPQVQAVNLGQMELDPTPGSHTAVGVLVDDENVSYASFVDLAEGQEVTRIALDKQKEVMDLAWCAV